MLRRTRLPPPAPQPLGIEDLEARPRPPLLSRGNVLRGAAIALGGLAWGAAVAFTDSLPISMGFLDFVLKVGGGLAFFLGLILLLLFRGFEVDRVAIIAVLALGGAWVGLAVGPTVPPAVVVAGRFTLAPTTPAGTPASEGPAECEWANGRWTIGMLRAAPIEGLGAAHVLTLDFLRRTISLSDDAGSTLMAVGNDAFVSPADAPPRGDGDRSGTLDLLLLQVDPASTPADPNEVRGRLTWECPGPPGA